MKPTFIYSITLLTLVSCGGNNSEPDQIMSVGEQYTVKHGDKIIKNSQDTTIKITHIDGESDSTVQLVKGKATIKH